MSKSEEDTLSLKIQNVTLYKTGIAYFEKVGTIDLDEVDNVNLSFKVQNMNDLLKTFIINKIEGDFSISNIGYESEQSNATKLLEDSLIKLPPNNSLEVLFSQLRGMEIEIKTFEKEAVGNVIGLETTVSPVKDNPSSVLNEQNLLLKIKDVSGTDKIESFKIVNIKQITIIEKEAREDFKFFLDVIGLSKNESKRTINVYFNGKGKATFSVSFLQIAPSWKTSYRIFILKETEEETGGGVGAEEEDDKLSIHFQAWGIIDNVLDEDWDDVHLRLISGIPISFKYDSYSPLYINRPNIERDQNISLDAETTARDMMKQSSPPQANKPGSSDPKDIIRKIIENNKLQGPEFVYDIAHKVKVKRNQSSLIPLIDKESEAKIMYVYNTSAHPMYPMATLSFHNLTGHELMEGPVSIFKNNIFEGEAVLPYMDKDGKHWIPYAIHQRIEIGHKQEYLDYKLHQIIIGKDLIEKSYSDRKMIYFVKNLSEDKKQFILEHPIDSSFKIHDSPDVLEKTNNFYRFKIALDKKENKKIEIIERKTISNHLAINNITMETIESWLDKKLISEEQGNILKKSLDFKDKLDEIERKILALQNRKESFNSEHSRIRRNLDALSDNLTDNLLRNRYIKKFRDQEDIIESIEEDVDSLSQEKNSLRIEFRKFIKGSLSSMRTLE